jgi:hypothetical protein
MSFWRWCEAGVFQCAYEGSVIGQLSAIHHTKDLQQRYELHNFAGYNPISVFNPATAKY